MIIPKEQSDNTRVEFSPKPLTLNVSNPAILQASQSKKLITNRAKNSKEVAEFKRLNPNTKFSDEEICRGLATGYLVLDDSKETIGPDPYAHLDKEALRKARIIYTPEDIEKSKQLAEAHNTSFFGGMVAPPISQKLAERDPAYVNRVISQNAKFLPQTILMGMSTPGIISGSSWSIPTIRAANIGLGSNMTILGVDDIIKNGPTFGNIFETTIGGSIIAPSVISGGWNLVKNRVNNIANSYKTLKFARNINKGLNKATKTWDGTVVIPDKVLNIELLPTLYPKGKHIFNTRKSTLTEAERLGIPKGERNNMSLDQIDALSDLTQYVRSGRFRTKFAINPETTDFGWFKDIPDGYVPILKFVADRNSGKIPLDNTNWLRIPFKSPETGLIGILSYSSPDKFNTATFSARFPKPKEMGWGPGEANAMIDGPDKNRGYQVIFTSPRTDAQDMVDASQEFINSLPNTIDKDIIKNFWILQSKAAKPGSYLSGDNGEFPLGNTLIGTYKQNGLSSAIQELRLVKRVPLIVRNGLSPDSYSSIIRQALRNGHGLRWGKGFTKWNNSAVKNLRIYNAWEQWKNGEISFEDYEKVFNSWADEIGGRHLLFMTSNGKKIPVHPHPFIYYKKQGGKVLLKTK